MARKKKKKDDEVEEEEEVARGFDETEADEEAEAEEMKSQGSESDDLSYEDTDSAPGIETYDEDTGEYEGRIVLGPKGATGDRVPLEITETLNAEFEYNSEMPKEETLELNGKFILKNPSADDQLWDIDISFLHEEGKEISWKENDAGAVEEPLYVKNLEPGQELVYEYDIEGAEKPPLEIKELISTLNDENVETYSLVPGAENTVLFILTAKNTAEYALKDLKITKEIISQYNNVQILDGSANAEMSGDGILWTLEELEAGAEEQLRITGDITATKEEKVRSGKISAEYTTESTLTGTAVDKFDAYTSNFVGISTMQSMEDPNVFDCSLIFENQSDFQVNLVNLDVVEENDPDTKLLDIDTGEIPTLASGAQWISAEWQTPSEGGIEPQFKKRVEFFVTSERAITTMGTISIDDIELAVALIEGKIVYSLGKLPSYVETTFDGLMEVKNTGGADLNELIMEETIQVGYIPPLAEEVELFVVRGEPEEEDDELDLEDEEEEGDEDEDKEEEEGDDEEAAEEGEEEPESEVDWGYLGDPISVDPSMIEIVPNDQNPDVEHVVKVNLENLQDTAIGMLLPEMIIRAKYPIKAFKPKIEDTYVANVKYVANTLPASQPLEIIPETLPEIEVIHIRTSTIKGKSIKALAADNQWEITLSIRNMGNSEIENFKIRDIVDASQFEYGEYSLEPEEVGEMDGKDLLIWNIDKIEEKGTFDITYQVTGKGDFRVSDHQSSV